MLSLTLGFVAVASADNLRIYDDRLQNGFEDWGWAPRSLTNASPVHSGRSSISVSAGAWEGLYFRHPDMDTHHYTNLIFWAHGGESGGQLLRIGAKLGTNDEPGYALPVALPANRWEQFTIPLGLFGVANRSNFAGLLIQLRDDSPTNSFFLDDIELEAEPSTASAPRAESEPASLQRSAPAPPNPQGARGDDLSLWIASGVAAILVLLAWLVFTLRKSSRAQGNTLLSVVAAGQSPVSSNGDGTIEFVSAADWRQRAIAAEAVASKQAQILRENLMPELAEVAKSSLVQGLSSQRNALIETQRRAQQELSELESRLAALHLPLRERILVYEKRITELEKELGTRGEEMRELIRATLSLVRARLEEEKKKEVFSNGSR